MTLVWVVALGVVAGLAVLGLVVLAVAWLRIRQQSWRVRAWAARQGWSYRPTDPDLADRWPDLPLMAVSGHARDVVDGQVDQVRFRGFVLVPGRAGHPGDTLRHVLGTGVVVVATPAVIPRVTLEPVGFVDALGWDDETVVSLGRADVDAAWRIHGDPATARALLDDAVVAWLLDPAHRGSYGFDQGELVGWAVDRIVPAELAGWVTQLTDLLALIPPQVWRGPDDSFWAD